MTSRSYEILCVVLLGLGQMSIMTGYDTQSFVQESVIHSVNERNPSLIGPYAGYYGQATCYVAYMLSCLIAPAIMSIVGPKKTLLLGSLCYTFYQVGFFFLNSYYYYTSCALMGLGFALYYTGNGGYLTSHSTRQTVEQNSAIAWAIACVCMLIGGGILATIVKIKEGTTLDTFTNGTMHNTHHRTFTDSEILWMYGAFTLFTIVSNIIFLVIPEKEIDNCIEGKQEKRPSFNQQMKLMLNTFAKPKMILLSLCFVHLGLYTSFWVSVYPTTMIFTESLRDSKYIIAVYSVAVGSGEIAMGFVISYMSSRVHNFCLKPVALLSFVGTLIVVLSIWVSTPQWAAVRPTDELAWLVQPSYLVVGTIGFFLGFFDSCINNARLVICALALPKNRAQSFSISKFYQALGGSALMIMSPYLSITNYTTILIISSTLSTVLYLVVSHQIEKKEKSVHEFKKNPAVVFE
ncbi:unnamed protein product [Auanema sp. JU1783]|nr:unnamed protein product [Auanema sp. JU1783]